MSTETTIATPGDTVSKLPDKLLKNRNFMLLATGQAISNIGDFVFSTTLLVWVLSLLPWLVFWANSCQSTSFSRPAAH
jgi:hypothetical protein